VPRSDRSNAISRIPIAAAAASAVAETERASSVLRLDDFVLSYPDHREDARNTRTLAREFESPSGLSPLKVNKISVNNNSHFTIQYHTTAYIHVRSKTDCYPVLSSARNRKRWFSKSKKRKRMRSEEAVIVSVRWVSPEEGRRWKELEKWAGFEQVARRNERARPVYAESGESTEEDEVGNLWEEQSRWLWQIKVLVKVKFSRTRYRALGPKLIPVYRQSARSWREVNHGINLAVGCHYFLPGLRLPP